MSLTYCGLLKPFLMNAVGEIAPMVSRDVWTEMLKRFKASEAGGCLGNNPPASPRKISPFSYCRDSISFRSIEACSP